MRRHNAPPKKDQYYIHRPGAYGIFTHPRGLLITAQSTKGTHEWQLPGGGIEAGEHPIEALTREAFEETGWRVHVQRKLGVWKQFTYMPEYDVHAEKICHIYLGQAIFPLGAPTEPDHQAVFMSAQKAAQSLVHKADRDFVTRFILRSHPHP